MKNRIQKVLTWLALAALIFCLLPPTKADAKIIDSGTCGDNAKWKLDDKGTLTISGTGKVTGGMWYLYHEDLRKVVFKEGITEIGSALFVDTEEIEELVLPESLVKIGYSAFYRCYGLKELTLPSGLKEIGDNAFAACHFERINITDMSQWISFGFGVGIHNYMYYDKLYLNGKLVTKLKIPEDCTEIPQETFDEVKCIKELTVPKSVSFIGSYAFYNCDSLAKVKLSTGISTLQPYTFGSCDSLKSLTVPDTVRAVSANVFATKDSSETSAIKKIYFKGDAPLFSTEAFNGVEATVYYPADNSTWTKSVRKNYGGKIKWVADASLSGSNKIPSVIAEGSCGENMTWKLDKKGKLTVSGTGKMEESPWQKQYRTVIKKAVIKEGVTGISSAFYFCSDLNEVQLPESLTEIESSAFGYTAIAEITIPHAVEKIGSSAFSCCTKLKSVRLPNSLKALEYGTFGNCKALKSITIPANVTKIEGFVLGYEGMTYDGPIYDTVMDEIRFLGDAPEHESDSLFHCTATVFYPKNNPTWTSAVRKGFGSKLTWKGVEIKPGTPKITVTGEASSGKPKVSWEKTEGAVKYQVYRASSESGTYKKLTTTTKTAYTDTSAKAGKKYYYKVRAVEKYGTKSSYSKIKARTCDLPRPVVEESNVSSGAIKLEWKKITGAEKYKIYRRVGKSGDYEYYKSTSKNEYTDENTTSGKVYYYKVLAVHSNTSANSAKSSGVGQTCKLPRPAVNEKNDHSSGAIKLEWTKISGAEKYKIYRRVGKSGDYEYYKSTSENKYTDENTTPGKVYYYKVLAVYGNTSANSAKSSGVGQTCKLPRPVVEESNIPETGKILLEWNAIEGAKGYKIYRRIGKDGGYEPYTETAENRFIDEETVPGTVYYYKVSALHSNSAANSIQSVGVGQTCRPPMIEIGAEVPEAA